MRGWVLALAVGVTASACSSAGGGTASPGGAGGSSKAGAGGSAPAIDAGGAGGDGGAGGTGGNGGSAGAGGSAASGGTGDVDAASEGDAADQVDASTGADASTAGADVGGPAASGFTCNLLVGPSPMMQWFRGGFLDYPGIDPAKWELISVAHHYTDAWAVPGDSAWNTTLDNGHACGVNAKAPDRVAFMATQWSHTTAEQWEKDLTGIVENIKTKWPGVKHIDLMPSTSAPGDKPCPAANGKNNETIIPSFAYEALEAMPGKYPGLVFSTPHFEVPSCSDFIGNGTQPQYAPSADATSGPAVMDVAKMFGAYFTMHL